LAKLPYGSPLRLHQKYENNTMLWRHGLTALKIGLWGGRGGRGGERGVGWGWFTFSTLLFFGQGGWERNCLKGWGERNFKSHPFYNFRGGVFFACQCYCRTRMGLGPKLCMIIIYVLGCKIILSLFYWLYKPHHYPTMNYTQTTPKLSKIKSF
jgi:hypothetical protein